MPEYRAKVRLFDSKRNRFPSSMFKTASFSRCHYLNSGMAEIIVFCLFVLKFVFANTYLS